MCSLQERPLRQLSDNIAAVAGQLAMTTARWLALIAEFDRRAGWADEGARSCAEWLAWRCALSPSAARDHVRVARNLERLPRVAALFARGELTYSKVRALVRLEDVAFEDELIGVARHATASQLERIVRGHRAVAALDADAAAARRRRFVRLEAQEDGSVRLSGRLEAQEAAVLEAALAHAERFLWDRERAAVVEGERTQALRAPAEHGSETAADDPAEWEASARRTATRADALVLLADTTLAAASPDPRSAAERHQVVLHVDLPTLLQSSSQPPAAPSCTSTAGAPLPPDAPWTTSPPSPSTDGEVASRFDTPRPAEARPARLADGSVIAPSVLRRLSCDAAITALTEQDGQALHAGRRSRTVPPALRRALGARDQGCRFPGCQARTHLDAHHIQHWADGGPTDHDNLVLLCRRHHTALHEGGFAVERLPDGTHRFRRPDGSPLADQPPLPCVTGRRRPRTRRRRVAPAGVAAGDALPYDHADAVEAVLRMAPPGGAGARRYPPTRS